MGTALCKNSKLPPQNQRKETNKNITIGVFGLNDAGKTSTVKAIEGDPTDEITPTISSNTTMVTHPFSEKDNRINKNPNSQRIRIIDVSGERKFRQQSWSEYYDQIHGLIFVIDASEKRRLRENQDTLDDLLQHDKLKNKPILILANKQDQRDAINNESDLKRKLDIEKLKIKYKIELCTALPQDNKNKVDESIRKGFSWLIRTIDENYTELNSRVTKAKNTQINRKSDRSESDENDSDNRYSKKQNTNNTNSRSRITSDKLPSINTNKNKAKVYSDDDDNDDRYHASSINGLNKKKKVLGTTNVNTSTKKSNDNEPKAFRSTYESFPEETPWSLSSTLKTAKSDDTLPKLYAKPSITNDARRRDKSPLVHDTKLYNSGSTSRRNYGSDDEGDFNRQQKSKSTNRLDNSSLSSNRLKKPTSGLYGDDDDDNYNNTSNHRSITKQKTSYNRYDEDDEENEYLKKAATSKSNKDSDSDDNKNYQRSSNRLNLNSEYRGTSAKPINRSKYSDDDDDDYHQHSSSKAATSSKVATHSRYDDDYSSSSKPTTRSKFNNDDYPYSSSKPASHSKYDDDDYPNSGGSLSKKTNYSSTYTGNNNALRSRFDNDDFFTSKNESNSTSRFRKNTDYDN